MWKIAGTGLSDKNVFMHFEHEPHICLRTTSTPTVWFTDSYQGTEMIIFESILTTFISMIVFKDLWGSSKNWLELKIEPP